MVSPSVYLSLLSICFPTCAALSIFLFFEGQRPQLALPSGHCILLSKHSGHRPIVSHQSLGGVFGKQGVGGMGGMGWIKRIGGRSESILSSAVLSLGALIRCCQCPLTDVFAQRSGPGSHAATTPPDTQPTQQQQNKKGDSMMPKPIASLSAINCSIHPAMPPSAYWLTFLWSLFTTSKTDSCPSLFGRKVRLNSRLKSSDESN